MRAADSRARLTDEVIDKVSGGRPDVGAILRHIRTDFDHYLARTAR